MSEFSTNDNENFTFGMLLRSFRERAGFSQEELAREIGLARPGTIGQWERGQLPSKSLDYITAIIQVLGLSESDAQTLQRALGVKMEVAQRPRQARSLLRFVPPLPDHAIERALAAPLTDALTHRTASGASQYAAVILSGLAGIGKTTLAKQVTADPAVQAIFPAGVLWLRWDDDPPEANFERWCHALGVQRLRRQSWQEAWFEWLRELEKAALLILDDVSGTNLRRSWLGEFLKALPECSAALITTQDGDAVTAEVQHWLPPARTQSLILGGLSPAETRALATAVLGRPPTVEEWELLQDISAALGGHPEGLRLAASTPAALRETAALLTATALPVPITALLEAQWARLSQVEQGQLSRLVSHARVGGVFGIGYAAAVWQVPPEQARCQLERLAGMGLIEHVTEVHDPLWPWPADYRIMPAVQRFLKSRIWSRQETVLDMLRATPTVLRATSHLRRNGSTWLRPPWQFRLAAFFWQFLLLPKALILGLLYLAQALGTPRRWFETWYDWTILLAAERLMRRRWAERGIDPPEEFWLLYDAQQGIILWSLVAFVMPAGITGLILGLLSIGLSVQYPLIAQFLQRIELVLTLAVAAVVAGYFWSMPWRYWVTCHYGVMTWDLRLLMHLTKLLGGRESEPSPT